MMPSSKFSLAAAGSGKTTRIVQSALAQDTARSLIVTYTLNNVAEIQRKIISHSGFLPKNVDVVSWYNFLLSELARPYQGALVKRRISGINYPDGRTVNFARRNQVEEYYFDKNNDVFADRLSDFVLLSNEKSKGSVFRRLKAMYQTIYIDEIQDMAGYDIDVIEGIMKAGIKVMMVGDLRQTTFATNQSAKNKGERGKGLLKRVDKWAKQGLCTLENWNMSWRNIQPICDLADAIFAGFPKTTSNNFKKTEHDGVFIVRSARLADYCGRFAPQLLRLDKRSFPDLEALNFGIVKGLGFERVLILPYSGIKKWIETGDPKHIEGSAEKVYVGVTRAFQSVAFLHDGVVRLNGARIYAD